MSGQRVTRGREIDENHKLKPNNNRDDEEDRVSFSLSFSLALLL